MNQQMPPGRRSRRNFLKTAAGLTFVFAIAPDALAQGDEALADTARPDGPYAPNVWLTIAPDGTITVVSPAAEMGQGSFTTLPLIIAEELDADWAESQADVPDRLGRQEIRQSCLRLHIPDFRKRVGPWLLHTASAGWRAGPPRDARRGRGEMERAGCRAFDRAKRRRPKISGRRIGYGEVAAFAAIPPELPKINESDLKPTANFRLIGKDTDRVDVGLKVDGSAKFGMDVQVPGMVYAAVLQSPYAGGAPLEVDDARARAVPGITDIVKLPEGVGVIGTTVEGTQAAKSCSR